MKPEPSTLSTPHKSNDVSHSKTPEDIALDKQILRSQIRPQRLIAKNARTAAEHEQMTQQYRPYSFADPQGRAGANYRGVPAHRLRTAYHRSASRPARARAPHPGARSTPGTHPRLGCLGSARGASAQWLGHCRTRRRRV